MISAGVLGSGVATTLRSGAQEAPFLTTYGTAYGPGGGSLFQDANGSWWLGDAAWSAPCTS